uniref:Uncharacterized protein n=1 Tax=Anguilla anguilla TaxID=7936 RepID=A0A0E9Y2S2_ANGAN
MAGIFRNVLKGGCGAQFVYKMYAKLTIEVQFG